MEVYRIHMGKAKCAVDLGDGSERGEYVDQDYILAKMGRPHRSISLMYCYYPLDEGWPGRASVVHASPDVSFAWDSSPERGDSPRGGEMPAGQRGPLSTRGTVVRRWRGSSVESFA